MVHPYPTKIFFDAKSYNVTRCASVQKLHKLYAKYLSDGGLTKKGRTYHVVEQPLERPLDCKLPRSGFRVT